MRHGNAAVDVRPLKTGEAVKVDAFCDEVLDLIDDYVGLDMQPAILIQALGLVIGHQISKQSNNELDWQGLFDLSKQAIQEQLDEARAKQTIN